MSNTGTNQKHDRSRLMHQLHDVFDRYELQLPVGPDVLLDTFESLNNPGDLAGFLNTLHERIVAEHGSQLAASVMPELCAIHAQIVRPALADLSYAQLDDALSSARTIRKFPDSQLVDCQAAPDMLSLLHYIQQNTPTLTKTRRLLNRKSVATINSLFVRPQQTVHVYKDMSFTDRDEDRVWKLRFLRVMATSAYMTYARKNGLHISKNGRGWCRLDTTTQVQSLFRIWCEDMDWAFWNPYYAGEVATALHFDQLMLYQAMLAMDQIHGKLGVSQFDEVCATLCSIDNTPDKYGITPMRHMSQFLILKPLEYLGMVTTKHSTESLPGLPQDYYLNDLGRWLLGWAVREAWSSVRAGRACPDCRETH